MTFFISSRGLYGLPGIFLIPLLVGWFSLAEACRIEEPPSLSPDILHRHIVGTCTIEERSALGLSAEELLSALEDGKSVDIMGLVVKGDLLLDRLPLLPIHQYPIPSPRVRKTLAEHGIVKVRVIPGSITIRESWFQGILATNLRNGALVIFGPVEMEKTKFKKSIDFSRAVFLDSINFSDTIIAYEGFFIGAYFNNEANFYNTAFGTHTRFHKAIFEENTTFHRAEFNGLAEFLEVMFGKDTNFSQTIYRLGTGFSGTQFGGSLDFSHALFEREAYFRFATFQQGASFQGTTFKEVADFSNAQFNENPDFTNAVFEDPPIGKGSKINFKIQRVRYFFPPTGQIGIFVGLFLMILYFILKIRKK